MAPRKGTKKPAYEGLTLDMLELSNEYEDLCLDIEKLEGLLKTLHTK